jgi:hypothetical protein
MDAFREVAGCANVKRKTTAPAQADIATTGTPPALYDNACRALAIDEVKDIHDQAAAIRAYARRAKNRQLEADAAALRMHAQRRLGEMIEAQKQTIRLNAGAAGGGHKDGPRGSVVDPRDLRPTLASQGIDKHLAHAARTLAALSEEQFEQRVDEARASAGRVVRRVVNEFAIERERETYRARTYKGGRVEDLQALAASGFRAKVIYVDLAWKFDVYSGKGKQRSAERY